MADIPSPIYCDTCGDAYVEWEGANCDFCVADGRADFVPKPAPVIKVIDLTNDEEDEYDDVIIIGVKRGRREILNSSNKRRAVYLIK